MLVLTTTTTLMLSLSSAFVVKPSSFSSSSRMMSSSTTNNNQGGATASSKAFNDGSSNYALDLQRDIECAGDNNSECSIEEIEELRDAVHDKRIRDMVMTEIIGATTIMKDQLGEEHYSEDKLAHQLISLKIEELTTKQGGTFFSDEVEYKYNTENGYVTVNNDDDTITTEQSMDSIAKEVSNNNNIPLQNTNAFMFMNEHLLESYVCFGVLGFMIYAPNAIL